MVLTSSSSFLQVWKYFFCHNSNVGLNDKTFKKNPQNMKFGINFVKKNCRGCSCSFLVLVIIRILPAEQKPYSFPLPIKGNNIRTDDLREMIKRMDRPPQSFLKTWFDRTASTKRNEQYWINREGTKKIAATFSVSLFVPWLFCCLHVHGKVSHILIIESTGNL